MNLVELLKKKKIIKFGEFTLRSGVKSTYYCDIKEVFGDPVLLRIITEQLVKIIPKKLLALLDLDMVA